MRNKKASLPGESLNAVFSRRHALAVLLGAGRCAPRALAASDAGAPVRLAISESLVTDVNLNDARAAMLIWLQRMMADLHVAIEITPRVFDATDEILRRARTGQLDAVALNVVEYRQIADMLDPAQIVSEAGAAGLEQYVLLVKRNGGIQRFGDLRGGRLAVLRTPKMCVAEAWLTTLLNEGHFGQSGQFFSSVTTETKAPRVVLPVFFGQTEAGITSKQGFDTMCELNPQVAKDLTALASSPPMVVTFYAFHKNYRGVSRERFARVYSDLRASPAGRQLATLFQFEGLVVKDAGCLTPALAILEAAERSQGRRTGSSGRAPASGETVHGRGGP